MNTPMQVMINELKSVNQDDPKTMIDNLKHFANILLFAEKHMVADAWVAGNKEGCDSSMEWPEGGDRYYEKKYNNGNRGVN